VMMKATPKNTSPPAAPEGLAFRATFTLLFPK